MAEQRAETVESVTPGFTGKLERSLPLKVIQFLRRWPVIPLAVLFLLVFTGVFAPWLTPHDPNVRTSLSDRNAPPFWYSQWYEEHPGTEIRFILGADPQGRDILSRLIDGARISLLVVAVALVVGATVGTALGLVSGYYGGYIDEVISRFWDIWAAIPFLLIALIIATVVGNTLWTVMGLLAMVSWSAFVRNVRAEALSLRDRDYVLQSRIGGASTFRIMWRHILPNLVNTIVVIATLRVGGLILAEASLSFLGVGIPRPQATWGNMVSDGRGYIIDNVWWVSFWPGLAIFLVVMSLNFLGDWLRDRWDPRLRQVST